MQLFSAQRASLPHSGNKIKPARTGVRLILQYRVKWLDNHSPVDAPLRAGSKVSVWGLMRGKFVHGMYRGDTTTVLRLINLARWHEENTAPIALIAWKHTRFAKQHPTISTGIIVWNRRWMVLRDKVDPAPG